MNGKDRHRGKPYHPFGDAAEEGLSEARAAVGTYDDETDIVLADREQDLLPRNTGVERGGDGYAGGAVVGYRTIQRLAGRDAFSD